MPIEIIAEAAQGYEGDATLARLLAKAAAASTADAIKFQLVYADELASPGYQHYDLFKQLEMPLEAWRQATHLVKDAGLRLYFDTFGLRSLEVAQELGADGVKIHSTDFFNTALHEAAFARMDRVFVSFGGITQPELAAFLARRSPADMKKLCLLYGFQAEPTPTEANNLARLGELRQRYPGARFGFMDHADGDADEAQCLAILALPYGVVCIEKHLTLDRALEIEDFPSGLPPREFARFAQRIRGLEAALGSAEADLTAAEQAYRQRALKVVAALRDIPAGHPLSEDDTGLLRVGGASHPAPLALVDVAGRSLKVAAVRGQQITWEMLA